MLNHREWSARSDSIRDDVERLIYGNGTMSRICRSGEGYGKVAWGRREWFNTSVGIWGKLSTTSSTNDNDERDIHRDMHITHLSSIFVMLILYQSIKYFSNRNIQERFFS